MWFVKLIKKQKKHIAREFLILLVFSIVSVFIYYSSVFIEDRLNTYYKETDIETVQNTIDSIKNLPKLNIIDEISCLPLKEINSDSDLEIYFLKKNKEILDDNKSKPIFLSESDFVRYKKYGPDYIIQEKGEYWTIDPYINDYIGTFKRTSIRRIADNYTEYISQKSFYDLIFENSKEINIRENNECLKRHLNLGISSFIDRNRLIDSLDIQEDDNYSLKEKIRIYELKKGGLTHTIYNKEYFDEIQFIVIAFIIIFPGRFLFYAVKWALKNYK